MAKFFHIKRTDKFLNIEQITLIQRDSAGTYLVYLGGDFFEDLKPAEGEALLSFLRNNGHMLEQE